MGLAIHSFLLSTCEHQYCQKREVRRKWGVGIDNVLLGKKLSYSAASRTARHLPCNFGYSKRIVAETCSEPNAVTSNTESPLSVNDDASENGTTAVADVLPCERDDPDGSVPSNPSSSSFQSSDREDYAEHPDHPSNGAMDNFSQSLNPADTVNLPSARICHDADDNNSGNRQNVNPSSISSNADEKEEMGKIRRFSLNDPALMKTLQESKVCTPLDRKMLDKILKFKHTNDNLKGQLVIRAVRTEQMKDLENLLTDSYSELLWGPLTYRPALAWILSTYLRERQAYLPHAVTLVGLYNPLEKRNADEESKVKWYLAGAVEVSFNASGKPKDMQAPLPPEDAPFLSNMAVLRKFRRRGIGRELLKAAEELVLQMGGNEMYLHCRMIDEAPLSMYKSSGYTVVDTDSLLSLLMFQRRRHLMYKRLPAVIREE